MKFLQYMYSHVRLEHPLLYLMAIQAVGKVLLALGMCLEYWIKDFHVLGDAIAYFILAIFIFMPIIAAYSQKIKGRYILIIYPFCPIMYIVIMKILL